MPPTCPNGALSLTHETTHRGYWDCVVPADHKLEDVLNPAYFGRIASEGRMRGRLCVGDIIEVEPESVEWHVRLRLMAYNRALGRAVTAVIFGPVNFDAQVAKGYTIRYRGAQLKWVIERGEDQVQGGFGSKLEASMHLEQLLADGRRM